MESMEIIDLCGSGSDCEIDGNHDGCGGGHSSSTGADSHHVIKDEDDGHAYHVIRKPIKNRPTRRDVTQSAVCSF